MPSAWGGGRHGCREVSRAKTPLAGGADTTPSLPAQEGVDSATRRDLGWALEEPTGEAATGLPPGRSAPAPTLGFGGFAGRGMAKPASVVTLDYK